MSFLKIFHGKPVALRKHKKAFVYCVIALFGAQVLASSALDEEYGIEKVLVLPVVDNVNGIYANIFNKFLENNLQQQFGLPFQKITPLETLLKRRKINPWLAYYDIEIIQQIAKNANTSNLLRCMVSYKNKQLSVSIDWVHIKTHVNILATQTIQLENASQDFLPEWEQKFQQAMGEILNQMPFLGMVTGQMGKVLTLTLFKKDFSLKSKDILSLSSVESVKRHPKTYLLTDWRLSPAGQIEVLKVENNLIFAKVLDSKISPAKYQKISKIVPVEQDLITQSTNSPIAYSSEEGLTRTIYKSYLSLQGLIGNYTFNYQPSSNQQQLKSLSFGLQQNLRLSFNSLLFSDVQLSIWQASFKNLNLTQKAWNILAGVGVFIPFYPSFQDPVGWMKFAIRSFNIQSVDLPFTGATKVLSLGVGAGVQFPLGSHVFFMDSFVRLLGQTHHLWLGESTKVSGVSDLILHLRWFWRFSQTFQAGIGLEYQEISFVYDRSIIVQLNQLSCLPAFILAF